ncbi:sulfhydryl oxidase 1-like isoform X2 [Coccinella septempunctata]|uniref:sulfhydryl oxidase 1-like isoform X2 n=1 Tax=Coccinella septempunctata TaxID=41139 RepID=UPI001D0601F7|nr:sulfhydryl oxidase 1-like isoform X2 [Coccinella septempunctata]
MAKNSTVSSNIGLFLIVLSVYVTISYSVSINSIHNRFRRNVGDTVQGLYNASDDVEELVESSFNKNVYKSDRAWFIEFYNTWCGHCRKYAPTYKAVAEYFRDCKDILVIAAIDCSNEINEPTCRYFEIMGYPSLRYFHENYLEDPLNLGLTVIKANDEISSNIQLVINTIIAEQDKGRAQMIPKLHPYNHSDVSKVFELARSEDKFAFLIIENVDLIGVQTILTFHRVPHIFITYALKSNEVLIDSLGVSNSLPTVVILSRDGRVVNKNFTNAVSLKDVIIKFLKGEGIEVEKYVTYNSDNQDKSLKEKDLKKSEENEMIDKVRRMGDVIFQMDLETALRFSLRQEISRTKIIEGDKLQALRSYVQVLVKYFPISKSGHHFLYDLSLLVTNSDSVKGTDISSLVKESEKEGKFIWSSPKQWLGCKGSTPETRGYPCGVWTMFHFLTVNAGEQNIGRRNMDPKEVLNAMYGYIKYFFGCADCSQHFQKMASERKIEQVSSLNEAIMWLWAAHNVVNARLAGDPTEDPLFPKKQFPTAEHCPECRYQNGSWNFYQVEQYMKHMYSSNNIRYIGSDMKVIHSDDGASNFHSNGILGPVDSKISNNIFLKWI